MIKITYAYMCDVCEAEIRPQHTYAALPLCPVPAPAAVAMLAHRHLCAKCYEVATAALLKCEPSST
jgi:hypothetical protein